MGGSRNAREGLNIKLDGALAGYPDLIVCAPSGKCLFLEVKAPNGKVSPVQRDLGLRLQGLGYVWAVVRSVDDMCIVLQEVGL